jgi:superfamily II DNA or RNA helicase
VVVDRQPLIEQWRDRLVEHLGIVAKEIGQLGGGRNRAKGIIDIAMAQSLARREGLADATSGYGLVIVDECHHVPAVTFERFVRQMVGADRDPVSPGSFGESHLDVLRFRATSNDHRRTRRRQGSSVS